MYAIITDIEKKHEEIITCRLIKIVTYEEMDDTVIKYMDKGINFDCVRTTWNVPNVGVLNSY